MAAMQDFQFTDSDLTVHDGRRALLVDGVFPGGVSVVDGNGLVVMPDQREVWFGEAYVGVEIVLDPFLSDGVLPGTWTIRYNRGARGQDGLSAVATGATADELMLYALIFG